MIKEIQQNPFNQQNKKLLGTNKIEEFYKKKEKKIKQKLRQKKYEPGKSNLIRKFHISANAIRLDEIHKPHIILLFREKQKYFSLFHCVYKRYDATLSN